jgi:hypothetical protein
VLDYPAELPGGVHPGLYVGLVGLNAPVVRDVYMQIEFPEHGPVQVLTVFAGPTFSTVGDFYDAILDAFHQIHPPLSDAHQLTDPQTGMLKITDQSNLPNTITVDNAIKLIKEQGEGTEQSAFEEDFSPNELAHYYRFMQIGEGKYIRRGADGKAHWDNTPQGRLPFPANVYPMAMVPKGGYPALLTAPFNQQFTQVLRLLEEAWNAGGAQGQQNLTDAEQAMLGLEARAVALMQQPVGGPNQGRGNYGPDFRLLL